MAVCTDKSVFYHIPKTGGIWVKEAMRRSGLPYGRCQRTKAAYPKWLRREHTTPDGIIEAHKAGRFSFAFVRHPVAWYRSFWAYRYKTQTPDLAFPLDALWDEDFVQFVRNALKHYQQGFVGILYRAFVGYDGKRLDYVGRQEHLREDTIAALRLAREDFDPEVMQTLHRFNVSAYRPKISPLCQVDERLAADIVACEHWVMETFYA